MPTCAHAIAGMPIKGEPVDGVRAIAPAVRLLSAVAKATAALLPPYFYKVAQQWEGFPENLMPNFTISEFRLERRR